MIFVKRLVLTTVLCAALFSAFTTVSATAGAAETDTVYPENFTASIEERLSGVSDFAVNGTDYAFASGNKITVLYGETISEFDIGSKVLALDCESGENNTVFYYQDGNGECFSLPDNEKAEHNFPAPDVIQRTKDGEYKLLENKLYFCPVTDTEYQSVAPGTDFSLIKNYGGTVYGLSGNSLYSFSLAEADRLELTYTDFSAADTIIIGNTAEKLKNYNVETLHYVTLSAGAYITEINLDELNGNYFKAGNTLKIGTPNGPTVGKTALLLCKTGANDEVSVIMFGGTAYLTRTESTEALNKSTLNTPEYDRATVSIAAGNAYSSPYVCEGTKLFPIKSGDNVKVLGIVTTISSPEIIRDFYLVEYEDGEESKKGYVPFGYISRYNYSENPPSVIPDKDFTTDDLIKTVSLVLVVVVLVLTAIGYIVYIATAGKTKKAARTDDEK